MTVGLGTVEGSRVENVAVVRENGDLEGQFRRRAEMSIQNVRLRGRVRHMTPYE